jgi:hypothetical protein
MSAASIPDIRHCLTPRSEQPMRLQSAVYGAALAAALASTALALASTALASPASAATTRVPAATIRAPAAAVRAGPQVATAAIPAVTRAFRGVPPLILVVPPQGRVHAVRLRMTRNPQLLTVTAVVPGVANRPIRIPPNDHRTRTLVASVRPRLAVTVRITGARRPVAGVLTY